MALKVAFWPFCQIVPKTVVYTTDLEKVGKVNSLGIPVCDQLYLGGKFSSNKSLALSIRHA
ncbi:hypothetical protein S7335_914 [Synechococcus sp. PCC 7335]|nr:hypothetical protein S7335_914 [Synechococcus sp. PCC 7335]